MDTLTKQDCNCQAKAMNKRSCGCNDQLSDTQPSTKEDLQERQARLEKELAQVKEKLADS